MKTPIEKMLDELDYKPTNSTPNKEGLPYVTHEGKMQIGDMTITVFVLNTGQRIIPADELEKFFGLNI